MEKVQWGFVSPEFLERVSALPKRTLAPSETRIEREVSVLTITSDDKDREVFLHIYPDTGIVGDIEYEGEWIPEVHKLVAEHGYAVYYWEQNEDEVEHFVLY